MTSVRINDIKGRVDDLIQLAEKTLNSLKGSTVPYSSITPFIQFQTEALSFLKNVFGVGHTFCEFFESSVVMTSTERSLHCALGILKAAKTEIDNGWVFSLKEIVSAEIFGDFFEMASHLLAEGFKDPAAVMIGSTLEEHLRQLCLKHGLPLTIPHPKTGSPMPIKADVMNAELTKAKVYNALDQKQVTAWLGLRNSAAHGKYNDYTQPQVEGMEQGVLGFIARTT